MSNFWGILLVCAIMYYNYTHERFPDKSGCCLFWVFWLQGFDFYGVQSKMEDDFWDNYTKPRTPHGGASFVEKQMEMCCTPIYWGNT